MLFSVPVSELGCVLFSVPVSELGCQLFSVHNQILQQMFL